MQMYLVRHGETDGISKGRYGDFALNERGRAQVARLARRLCGERFTHVYSSPMLRARQTAQLLVANRQDLAVVSLDGLCEVDIGAFAGLTRREAITRYPWFFAQSRACPTLDFRWPDGETTAQVLDRARRTWHQLWDRHRERADVLLVVSHTFYLNLFLLAVLDQPFPNRFWFKVELAGYVHVEALPGRPPWIVFDSCA